MSKKVLVSVLFGTPFPDDWMRGYLENLRTLGQVTRGQWQAKIFMPQARQYAYDLCAWSGDNGYVEMIDMTLAQFDRLVEDKTGVRHTNVLREERPGIWTPQKLLSCYFPAFGHIFEDYLREYSWWAHVPWDMVWGRLDRFFVDADDNPDVIAPEAIAINDCDIYGNDPDAINGCFSLYRNARTVNRLYRGIPDWRTKMFHPGPDNKYTFDEYCMTDHCNAMARMGALRFKTGWLMTNDAMPQHWGAPKLHWGPGATLIDSATGRECAMFHFKLTKRWPIQGGAA